MRTRKWVGIDEYLRVSTAQLLTPQTVQHRIGTLVTGIERHNIYYYLRRTYNVMANDR